MKALPKMKGMVKLKMNHKIGACALSGMLAVCGTALADASWEKVDVLRNDIAVEVNGVAVTADNFLYNDTTYLPIRAVGEMLGMEVSYDEAANKAVLTTPEAGAVAAEPAPTGEKAVSAWEQVDVLRNDIAVEVDGAAVTADNFLYNDTTYLPIRAVGEMLGMEVSYDAAANKAVLSTIYAVVFEGDTVGTVNGQKIPSGMLNSYISALRGEMGEQITEAELTDLAKSGIVENVIIRNEAKNRGFRIDEQFNQSYDNLIYFTAGLNGGTEAFYAQLEEAGYTPEFHKHYVETMECASYVLDSLSKSVTDKDVAAFYEENKESFRFDGVRVKHILIKTVDDMNQPLPDAEIKKAKALADKVYAEAIKKDADFDALIAEYNEDPGMTTNPDGYLVNQDTAFVENFKASALELKPGEITKPVETEYGYHIIRCEEAVEYSPVTDSATINSIRSYLGEQRMSALVMLLVQNADVSWNE